MENKVYLSKGYPIGIILEAKNKRDYHIELCGEDISFAEKLEFVVWSNFTRGNTYEQAFKESQTMDKITKKQFNKVLESLVRKEILVEINDEYSALLDKIRNNSLFRQGVGIGADKDVDKYYIGTEEKVELDLVEYSIWLLSDGRRSVIEILNLITDVNIKENLMVVLISIINLYKKGLIYII